LILIAKAAACALIIVSAESALATASGSAGTSGSSFLKKLMLTYLSFQLINSL
jgi:hypothetical protein